MKIKYKRGLLTGGIVSLLVLLMNSYPAYSASGAILSSVNIEGINNSFNITLKTSKDTEVLTRVPSSDKLIIELQDTLAAQSIKTSFKKATQIEDIIVQPLNNGKIRLFISGNNVSRSKIIVDSSQVAERPERYVQQTANNIPYSNQIATQKPVNNGLERQINQNKTVSSQDFITQNSNTTNNITPVNSAVSNPQTNISTQNEQITNQDDTANVETTGVESNVPVVEEISDNITSTNAETENSQDAILAEGQATDLSENSENSQESDMFKPVADTEMPNVQMSNENPNTAAAIIPPQNNSNSFFSKTWLIRFGIVFAFITLLIAYLRKEKLISFKPKAQKKSLNYEHLDIYRSLHKSTQPSTQYNKNTTRTAMANIDRKVTTKQYVKPKDLTQNPGKNLVQRSALNSYANQNQKSRNYTAANVTPKYQPQLNTMVKNNRQNLTQVSANKNSTEDNVTFLKKMAELYERTGRHDLAANIQKNLRKSSAKV